MAIIEKVCNARFSNEFRKYRQKYIVRKSSENRLNLTLRGDLKATGYDKDKKTNEIKMETKNTNNNTKEVTEIKEGTVRAMKEKFERKTQEKSDSLLHKRKPNGTPRITPGRKGAPERKEK